MRNRDRAVSGSSSRRIRATSASAGGPPSACRRTAGAARKSGSSISSREGETDPSIRAISAWARNAAAAKRSGASADGAPGASSSARAARRSNCETTSAAGLFTRHFAEPARMVQAGPGPRHSPPRHRAEGSRLAGGAEVDVEDDRHEEEDEGDVVDHVARLAEDLVEGEREPHHDAGDENADRSDDDGPEEELLARVVLAHFGVVALVAHVLDEARTDPGPLLLGHAHLGSPVERHPEGEDEEGDPRPGMDHAASIEPAEQPRQPAEHGRPDGQACEEAEEERHRHEPVRHANHQTVAPDDVADHEVLVALGADHAGTDTGMDDSPACVRR